MAYNDLLDDYDKKEEKLWTAISWWEERRLRFNMIVGGFGILVLLLGAIGSMSMITTSEPFLFAAVVYGISCNVAYIAGWVLDMLLQYYFSIEMSAGVRATLFWLGTCVAFFPILSALVILLVG